MGIFGRKRDSHGEQLVAKYNSGDPGLRAVWDLTLAEGATLDDMREFYDWYTEEKLDDVLAEDNLFRATLYRTSLDDGLSEEEAIEKALRATAFYGSPGEIHPRLKGEDRPLPHELKPRVNRWAVKQGLKGGGAIRNHGFTSMNALIRAQMRAGKL